MLSQAVSLAVTAVSQSSWVWILGHTVATTEFCTAAACTLIQGETRDEELARLVKCLPHKHGDLNWLPKNPHSKKKKKKSHAWGLERWLSRESAWFAGITG